MNNYTKSVELINVVLIKIKDDKGLNKFNVRNTITIRCQDVELSS